MEKRTEYKVRSGTIVENKRARQEYFIEEECEAGVSLQGWEVKSLREGKANIVNGYVLFKKGEAFLFGTIFQPLISSSFHLDLDPARTRKLLLNKRELYSLSERNDHKGYTLLVLSLYWKNAWVKVTLGIAKGKKKYDKRTSLKEREWQRTQARIIKHYNH